jgi:hypothetical protein
VIREAGSIVTLNEVKGTISGMVPFVGLELPNQTLSPDSLHLSRRDKSDLVTFLKALTDTTSPGSR